MAAPPSSSPWDWCTPTNQSIGVVWLFSEWYWECPTDHSYGKPITMDAYAGDFINGDDTLRRATVKRLTKDIYVEMVKMTVNSPDWYD